MMITFQIWMDADVDVVFGAMNVVRIGTGKAAIVWVTAGLSAVVRIPIVSGVVISHDVIKSVTVIFMSRVGIDINIICSRANSLIVHLNILVL